MIERNWRRNPYLRELKHGLSQLGVEVVERRRFPVSLGVDVVHLHSEPCHWVTPHPVGTILKFLRLVVQIVVAVSLRQKLVYTVHDIHPSTAAFQGWRRWLFIAFRRWFFGCLDGLLFHSNTARIALREESRNLPHVVTIGHPLYRRSPKASSGPTIRERLGIDEEASVFLLFGDFREHKNPDWFLRAYAQWEASQRDKTHLLIAGFTENDISARIALPESVHFLGGYVEEEDIPQVFAATDWVVLPYSAVTCSGLLHLAATYEVPLLATDHAYFREITADKGALFFSFGDDAQLALALHNAQQMQDTERSAMGRALRTQVAHTTWIDLAEACRKLYEGTAPPIASASR